MRITVLILALVLMIPMAMQSLAAYSLARLTGDENLIAVCFLGLVVALLWVIGAAIVLPAPRASAVVFGLAMAIAYLISGIYGDMLIWGTISLALMIMAYMGHRQKAREDRRRADLEAVLLDLRRSNE